MTDELVCECGHPHVNPDGSGSCSRFICLCRTFKERRHPATAAAWAWVETAELPLTARERLTGVLHEIDREFFAWENV